MLMDSRQDFIEFVLEHYENPRNHGAFEPTTIVMKGGNPTCGDLVTVYLDIDPAQQTIRRLQFTGEGCTISQAAASLTTSRVQGRSVAEAHRLRASDLLPEFEGQVMTSRRRCATLALHTLRAALSRYLDQTPTLDPQDGSARGLRFEEQ